MHSRTVYALAMLLLLVQLPHAVYLPIWVSLLGGSLVAARLLLLKYPNSWVLYKVLSPLSVTCIAISSAILLRWDYGYLIGRDPSVAFLFVLVAAKFAEVRRSSDATLLLCLAAFLLLTQYFYSQSIIAAAITLPGVIALAYALSILRDPANPAGVRYQLRMILMLLVQGLPLAAVLFLVFPRLSTPLWSLPDDATASSGLSDSMSPGSISELSQSNAVAFRVEFNGAPPENHQLYWRGPVLTEFNGRSWHESRRSLESTRHYQGPATNLTSYSVMLQPHRQRWLFALDAAVGLPQTRISSTHTNEHALAEVATDTTNNKPQGSPGRFFSDGQIKTDKPVTQILRYYQSSILSDAVTPEHHPLKQTLYLPGRNTRSIAFAQELYKTYDSNSAYAEGVLEFFNRESFSYTLRPGLLGDRPVDEFIFDTRAGFCEHYASAFVVLMRAAGIPARVVTGYLGGEMNAGYMIVRQSDAHAWAEAFIDGQWHRFDPTGAVAPMRVEQSLAAALPEEATRSGLSRTRHDWFRKAQLRWDALNHQWQRLVVNFDKASQSRLLDRLGLTKPALWQITVAILAIAAIWSYLILGLPGLTSRRQSRTERQWQKLLRLLKARGLVRLNAETPQEFFGRAMLIWPKHSARLKRIEAHFNAVRFKPADRATLAQVSKRIDRDFLVLWFSLRRRKRQSGNTMNTADSTNG